MAEFKFDKDKAINVTLYISSEVDGIRFHKLFKILYFADLKHIARYGRPIVGDNYIAMKDGPVPSRIYDYLKAVKLSFLDALVSFFHVNEDSLVKPKIKPDLDLFSDSDIECLNESIRENRNLSYGDLVKKSHDDAWKKTWNKPIRNKVIPIVDIIAVSGASTEMREYINQIEEYNSFKMA